MLKDLGSIGCELIEVGPADKLTINMINHIFWIHIVIATKSFNKTILKRLNFLFRDSCYDLHLPSTSALADDPMTKENKSIIDMCNMSFIHI
ncbi:hypothetical protein MNBD_ALPHA03-969 [hydrothermal vent metagenome]|uniref:Uncharacterized protein n=1 Tax=hydrothermal vent metagenome TaxID=652676 RepID=A0A3B1BSY6_9ZZZZ